MRILMGGDYGTKVLSKSIPSDQLGPILDFITSLQKITMPYPAKQYQLQDLEKAQFELVSDDDPSLPGNSDDEMSTRNKELIQQKSNISLENYKLKRELDKATEINNQWESEINLLRAEIEDLKKPSDI